MLPRVPLLVRRERLLRLRKLLDEHGPVLAAAVQADFGMRSPRLTEVADFLVLRTLLWRLGYFPYGWEQGFNFGPRHGVVAGCRARVEELFVEHEHKLTLIGWSLGGIYAREIAKLVPECVRQVITLGSPFKGDPRANNAYEIFRLLSGHRVDANLVARIGEKPPVPTTSIYSKSDGVVPWQASHEAEHEEAENIVVKASHLGLGFNPMALYAIADRLAQREDQWRPFERRGLKRLIYPDAFAL